MEDSPGRRDRRSFLNWFLATSVGALAISIAYPIFRFISPPRIPDSGTNQVEAGFTNDAELLDTGFKIVRFGDEPVIVIRVDDGDFRAFAGTCTHLDCIVEYRRDKRAIWCNCHNGQYNLRGKQVAGPPPRPLEPFRVDLVAREPGQPRQIVISRT
jgi:Rieske Fe-S protein